MSESPPDKTDMQSAFEALRVKMFQHKNLAIVVSAAAERIAELQMNPDENQREIEECTQSVEFFMRQIKDQSIDMFEMFNNIHIHR